MVREMGKSCIDLAAVVLGHPFAVEVLARKGFGSCLIERGLASELGGEVKIYFYYMDAVCLFNAPLEIA